MASTAAVSRRLLFASHGRRACSTACLVRQHPVDQSSGRQRQFSTSQAVTRGHHRESWRRLSGTGKVPAAPVSMSTGREFSARSSSTCPGAGTPLLTPAGPLSGQNIVPGASDSDSDDHTNEIDPPESDYFIPQIVHEGGVSVGRKKRVLVLCTGGTLTSEFWSCVGLRSRPLLIVHAVAVAPNPSGALEPVPGAFTDFMKSLLELASGRGEDGACRRSLCNSCFVS